MKDIRHVYSLLFASWDENGHQAISQILTWRATFLVIFSSPENFLYIIFMGVSFHCPKFKNKLYFIKSCD